MSSFKKRAGTTALTFALLGGLIGFSPVAGATPAYGHHHGRSHGYSAPSRTVTKAEVENNNDIRVRSSNYQTAVSGNVRSEDNTTAGSAASGSASNSASVSANIAVDNTASGEALMDAVAAVPTSSSQSFGSYGHGSHGGSTSTSTELEVENNNTVDVALCNDQMATTGNVTVEGNTTAGNATSGNASNTSSATLSINVAN